jgi:endonuclease YncB( thermonuclease family)
MLRVLLLVVAGSAAVAAAYLTLAPSGERNLASPAPAGPAGELRPGVPPAAEAAGEVVARSVRDVTPREITAGPVVKGPLTRIAPPARPEEPKPVPQARTERLFNPIIAAAGLIRARGREIRLAGIAAPDFEARCGDGLETWPCGRMARAALRRFVRGRAIECAVPAGAAEIPDPGSCSVAGQNLAEWLVSQGWAKRDGEKFAEIEAKARAQKLGVWGAGRPDAQPEAAAAGLESAPDSALAISPRVSATP